VSAVSEVVAAVGTIETARLGEDDEVDSLDPPPPLLGAFVLTVTVLVGLVTVWVGPGVVTVWVSAGVVTVSVTGAGTSSPANAMPAEPKVPRAPASVSAVPAAMSRLRMLIPFTWLISNAAG
jgi:hypothetical protein